MRAYKMHTFIYEERDKVSLSASDVSITTGVISLQLIQLSVAVCIFMCLLKTMSLSDFFGT